MDNPMKCDCCKQETDTLFTIKVLSLGDKDVCPKCYLKMTRHINNWTAK